MGCGASKGAVVNSVEAYVGSDETTRSGDKGNATLPGYEYDMVMDKSKNSAHHQELEVERESKAKKAKDPKTDVKVSDLTPVEYVGRIMEMSSVEESLDVEYVDINKEDCNLESRSLKTVSKTSGFKQSDLKTESKTSGSKQSDLLIPEPFSDSAGKFSVKSVCEGPLLSSETVKENISSSDPHGSNNEAITGSPESSQKEAPSDAEAGVHHMKEQLGSGSSDASSNRGRFAAFDVPVSTDARTLQHKFSDKSDKMDEGELMEKLQEKQRAAAARKEEELKKRARTSSRVSMKDRLRKEIMESRKQEEEAGLLDPEETEEDETGIPDEIEKDAYFNEPTQVEEF